MNTFGGKGTKKSQLLRFIEFLIAMTFAVYIVPAAKKTLFPDQMTRLENMLRQSAMDGYHLAVDRKDDRDVIRELEPSDDTRVFFSYSVNRDSNEVFYLTRTRIEADSDLKWVKRLEVAVCGQLADQHAGVTHFDGYEPVYECEVPVQQAVCLAAEPTAISN